MSDDMWKDATTGPHWGGGGGGEDTPEQLRAEIERLRQALRIVRPYVKNYITDDIEAAFALATIDEALRTDQQQECEHEWLHTADLADGSKDIVGHKPDGLPIVRASGRHCLKCGLEEKIADQQNTKTK